MAKDVFAQALDQLQNNPNQGTSDMGPNDSIDVFAAALHQAGQSDQVSEPDYSTVLKKAAHYGIDAIKNVFPEISGAVDAFNAVEPYTRPIVNSPLTGVGGLMDVAQGKGLEQAAEDIRAGKTAGENVASTLNPNPSSFGGKLLNLGIQNVVDMPILTGATEGFIGKNNPFPKIELDLTSKAPEELPALPRPYDIDVTAEPTAPNDVFEAEMKKPGNDVFENVLQGKESPEEYQARMSQMQTDVENHFKNIKASPSVTEGAPVESSETGSVAIPGKEALDAFNSKFDISGQYDELQGLKAEHFGDLAEKVFNDELTIQKITSNLSPLESEAMPFVAEKSAVPMKFMNDPAKADLVQLIQHPTQNMIDSLKLYDQWRTEKAQELTLHAPDFSERTDYVPHILNYPIEIQSAKTGGLTGKTAFTHQRTLSDLGQAIDLGYTPKFNNFRDVLKAYSGSVNKAISERQFANFITKASDASGEPFAYPKQVMGPTGEMVRNERLPTVVKDGKDLSPLLAKHYFTPKVYDQLKFMKGLDVPENYLRAFDQASAAVKKAELSLSVFHYMTLGESSVALGVNPIKLYNMVKEGYKAGGAAFVRPELTKDALKHNLVLSASADVEQGALRSLGESLDRGINEALAFSAKKLAGKSINPDVQIASQALKPISKLEEVLDTNLWKQFQPAIKLLAYEHNVAVALGSGKFNNLTVDALKRQVADVVNSFAGGQQWELIFNDPNMQQALKRSLLALDWTASNIRIPLSLPDPGVKGYTARRAYFRMALLFLGVTESLNYLNSKVQEGKGRFTWTNDPNHRFDVFLYKDKKGMNHYMTVNKGFVEVFRWLSDPATELGHKLNPVLQTLFEQISGHTVGGYDLDFAKPGNRLKAVADKILPFSFSGNSLGGAFPVSQGISYSKIKTQLETAIYKNDDKKIQELKATALNNGIQEAAFNKLYKQIQGSIKGKEKYEKQKAQQPSSTSQYVRAMAGGLGTNLGEAFRDEFKKIKTNIQLRNKK